MLFLELLYAVLFPALLGFSCVNIFLSNKEDATLFERLALGFCLGMMLITAVMFYVLPRFNLHFSASVISLTLLPILIAGLYVTIKNGSYGHGIPRLTSLSLIEKILLVLLAIQVLFVFSSLMIKPVSGWDAWQGYSFRAKTYFVEGTPIVPSMPYTVRGQHVALTQTWVFLCINEWQEIMGKINFSLFYVSLLIMFFYAVKRFRNRSIALITTYMLSALPFLAYHATLEYCDIVLAIYLFAGISLMYRWFNDPKLRYLILSFVFLFSMITIKPEAFFHLTIVLMVFAASIFSRKLDGVNNIKMIRRATVAILIVGALFMYRIIFLVPHESLLFLPSLKFLRITALFSVFGDYLFVRNNWGMIWPLLIVLLALNFKRLKDNFNFVLLAMVALELFGFMAYYFTQLDWVYEMLFYVSPAVRNTLQFMPVTVFLVAALLTLEMPAIPSASPVLNNKKERSGKRK